MPEEAWSFRTASGTATVRDGEIRTDSSPGRFLAAQRARWHNGDWLDRGKVALDTVAPLVVLGLAGIHFATAADLVTDGSSLLWTVLSLAAVGASLYRSVGSHVGNESTVPIDDVTGVAIDAEELTMTVAYESGDGPLWINRGIVERTYAFPTEEDLRDARKTLDLKGVSVPPVARPETETVRRVDVRQGACFCERCGTQVSPADRTCPACGYELRVEEPAGTATDPDRSGSDPGGSGSDTDRSGSGRAGELEYSRAR